ncbi:Glutathione S-transferase/chloride channel, C-terminal [Artemisia annua]|uniref:glutathione transferase n=1 Tax=Artemisia annua TaxID=35608 RepID=A0A2U1PVS7_ARTAN|nr:Glutathione S-transferase/chloride channel, C-terminal [Artemisia annua]
MAKKCELKLVGIDASPYVNRVQVVLKLKSIDYEYIKEHYPSKSELLLTSNPVHKKVPVLLHANKSPIPESLVIIEYLDETHPDAHQILPKAPLDRAESRLWVFYIDNTLWRMYEELRLAPGKEEKEEVKKRIIEAAQLLEWVYAKSSNGKTYFGGDDLSYIDVVLGCFLPWTGMLETINDFKVFDDVRTPGLAAWAKCIRSHEAFKSVCPEDEALMDLYMIRQKYKTNICMI